MRVILVLSLGAAACADTPPPASGEHSAAATAADPARCTIADGGLPYSPYKHAFFGNLHQHTSYSLDAYGFGTRNTPADAYAYAKGDTALPVAEAYLGTTDEAKPLARPLDFLAITDHSEWLGDAQKVPERSAWRDEQDAAADAYEPCRFTSLLAYEWTSMPDDGNGATYNNHHNVIFGSATVPVIPLDSDTYDTTSKLFHALDRWCTGDCAALAIPHNTNESEGISLALPADLPTDELALQGKYQKLVEIYQHKGASECFHDPTAGSDDGCGFEYADPGDGTDSPQSYVRTSLGNGIAYAASHGTANPLELGIIASTDDHNGIAGLVEEDQFHGHLGITDASAKLRLKSLPQFGPGGLAGVWAEQNTRTAIFAGLQNRETFGTSGPRMRIRMYETTSSNPCMRFPQAIVDAHDAVPMGGTFHAASGGTARFAIEAWPDTAKQPVVTGDARMASFAALEMVRVRTIADGAGGKTTEESVVPVSGLPAAGGCTVYEDTDLGSLAADDQVVYYARVRQEPTWRWTHFDCAKQPDAAACSDPAYASPIQERAWTSPIWYVPQP